MAVAVQAQGEREQQKPSVTPGPVPGLANRGRGRKHTGQSRTTPDPAAVPFREDANPTEAANMGDIEVAAAADHPTEEDATHAAGLDLTLARVIHTRKTETCTVHTPAVLCHLEDVTLAIETTRARPDASESLACRSAPLSSKSTTSSLGTDPWSE